MRRDEIIEMVAWLPVSIPGIMGMPLFVSASPRILATSDRRVARVVSRDRMVKFLDNFLVPWETLVT